MTYVRDHQTATTIVGADAFHDSVRNGKRWDHIAPITGADVNVKENCVPRTAWFGTEVSARYRAELKAYCLQQTAIIKLP